MCVGVGVCVCVCGGGGGGGGGGGASPGEAPVRVKQNPIVLLGPNVFRPCASMRVCCMVDVVVVGIWVELVP